MPEVQEKPSRPSGQETGECALQILRGKYTSPATVPAPRQMQVVADPCSYDDGQSPTTLTHATRWAEDAASGRATTIMHPRAHTPGSGRLTFAGRRGR